MIAQTIAKTFAPTELPSPFNLPTNQLDPEIRKLIGQIQRQKRKGKLPTGVGEQIRQALELKYPITKPTMPNVTPRRIPNMPKVPSKLESQVFGTGQFVQGAVEGATNAPKYNVPRTLPRLKGYETAKNTKQMVTQLAQDPKIQAIIRRVLKGALLGATGAGVVGGALKAGKVLGGAARGALAGAKEEL